MWPKKQTTFTDEVTFALTTPNKHRTKLFVSFQDNLAAKYRSTWHGITKIDDFCVLQKNAETNAARKRAYCNITKNNTSRSKKIVHEVRLQKSMQFYGNKVVRPVKKSRLNRPVTAKAKPYRNRLIRDH